jgi:metallophosphoesterase superfamily enzyme
MELPWFFQGLGARSVELVRGNHDVDLQGLVDIAIHEAGGIRLGGATLLHGHEWPDEALMDADTRVVVTCHNHPAVMLVDALGHRHKEAAWVRARFTPKAAERYPRLARDADLIVMPAFNELTGGTAFNAPEGDRLLGPLFGNGLVDVDGARLWTVDGVDLGTIESLRKYGGRDEKPARGPRMFGRGKK